MGWQARGIATSGKPKEVRLVLVAVKLANTKIAAVQPKHNPVEQRWQLWELSTDLGAANVQVLKAAYVSKLRRQGTRECSRVQIERPKRA